MKTKVAWIVVLAVAAGLLGFLIAWRIIGVDPAAAPELSLPPPLLTKEQLGERQFLFDGQTSKGWKIEGRHQIKDGTLVLGGEGLTRASLERTFDPGEQIEFHFFQEGPAGAKLWVKPTLIDPKDRWAEHRGDHSADLNLAGYVYRRWHAARASFTQDANHIDMDVRFHPLNDGLGNHAHHRRGFPSDAGCRFQVSFEVGPQARLYLRDVVIGKQVKRE